MTTGAPLLLVPTEMELEHLLASSGSRTVALESPHSSPAWSRPRVITLGKQNAAIALCGVGVAAAAAACSRWFAATSCTRALLVGCAGAYPDTGLLPGTALVAGQIECEGIGAMSGDRVEALSFPQFPASVAGTEVRSSLSCEPIESHLGTVPTATILTVCAASGSAADAERRRRDHPSARVEDMESFGAALAARLHGVRLSVVRGVSNIAGDRDPARWRIADALSACWPCIDRWLGGSAS